jgi:hypothetical protein
MRTTQVSTMHPDRLKPKEAAKYIRVSLSTLAKWRMRKKGPPYHRCGTRLIYYIVREVDAWLMKCDADDRPL